MMLLKDEIIERVNNCEGLSEIEILDDCVSAYDDIEGRELNFRFLENLNFDEIFHFGTFKLDKERFYELLKQLDPILFLMPRKIYFISNEEELEKLEAKYECQSMNIHKHLGINWYADTVIIINIYLIKKIMENKDFSECFSSVDTEYNFAVWTTLIHELRHMVCDSGLIISEEEIPLSDGEEDAVEENCNYVFDEVIAKNNFLIFN